MKKDQEGGEEKTTDGLISQGMWIKMSESQAGSELPSGEEDGSTEITSKPGVTGLQMLLVDYIYRDEPQ